LIDCFAEKDWLDSFERGIINKYGYAITYEFSHNLGKEAERYMLLLKRPLEAGKTNPLIDDSLISQMFLFGDELVKEIFGDEYELSKVSILLSTSTMNHEGLVVMKKKVQQLSELVKLANRGQGCPRKAC
jgi:hypothetical protein